MKNIMRFFYYIVGLTTSFFLFLSFCLYVFLSLCCVVVLKATTNKHYNFILYKVCICTQQQQAFFCSYYAFNNLFIFFGLFLKYLTITLYIHSLLFIFVVCSFIAIDQANNK